MDQPALKIDLTSGPHAPAQHYRFPQSPVRIGRGPRNELVIDHAFVSHSHGVLHFDSSGIDFVDLGSTNGSFLGQSRLAQNTYTSVPSGSTLAIGTARLRVQLDASQIARTYVDPDHHAGRDASAGMSEHAHARASQVALAELVARFAQGFLELARAQVRWRGDLGLPTTPRSELHVADDPIELVRYLLAPDDARARLDELSAACAELMFNELALVAASRSAPDLGTGFRRAFARSMGHSPDDEHAMECSRP